MGPHPSQQDAGLLTAKHNLSASNREVIRPKVWLTSLLPDELVMDVGSIGCQLILGYLVHIHYDDDLPSLDYYLDLDYLQKSFLTLNTVANLINILCS